MENALAGKTDAVSIRCRLSGGKVLGGSKNQEMKRRRTIQSEGRVPVIMVHELVGRVSVMDGMSLLSPSSGRDGRAGARYRKSRGRQPPRSQMLGRPLCVWAMAATIGRVKEAGGFVDEGVR
jgi:hypothetical protein